MNGSLSPLRGGLKHLIKLSVEDFWLNDTFLLHFALRTIDKNNNISPISNTVSANFGVLKKLKILYQSMATLKERTVSQKLNIDIKNTTTNGLFRIDIENLQDLKVYFRSPNNRIINEKSNGFMRDEINGKVELNYENNLFGNWILYIQRLHFENARDINFSIKTIIT